ncbi:MAG: methionyl-tRNA formyltransferase [Parcubacteria group bacterium Gr01-1014_33]|nr:MAG: methionyl-tRNA formyltransferase [Parcubacteria group bacterium Gr01-1014_33]
MAATKIIFFGTSAFALPSLKALIRNDWVPLAVVTKPDESAGRKQVLTPPPVKEWITRITTPATRIPMIKEEIKTLQPEKLNEDFALQISHFKPDLFIVAAYGKIIPKEILDIPRLGVLNIHPSLLPRWRGPSPIQCAILNGDTETGVTIMQMDEEMDHGPIITNNKLPITNNKIIYTELHDSLAQLGAELLVETLPQWIEEKIQPIPQDNTKATYSKILKKDDGRINWSRPAEEIERMVRAFTPWPGTWTMWPSEKLYRIRIDQAVWEGEEAPIGSPGYIWQKEGMPLLVKTGKGSLAVTMLTIEGKKPVPAAAFVRGYPDIVGATLV